MIRIGLPLLIIGGMGEQIITNLAELRVLFMELFQSGEIRMYSTFGLMIWTVLSIVVMLFVHRQSNKTKMVLMIWLTAFLLPPISLYPISLIAKWLANQLQVNFHLIYAMILGLIIIILLWVIIRRNYQKSKFYFYRKRKSISVVLLLPYLWLYVSVSLIQWSMLAGDVSPRQIFFFAVAALVAIGTFAFGTDLRQI